MEDMKEKAKELFKNLGNPFASASSSPSIFGSSSSSSKFKGQGHRLGTAADLSLSAAGLERRRGDTGGLGEGKEGMVVRGGRGEGGRGGESGDGRGQVGGDAQRRHLQQHREEKYGTQSTARGSSSASLSPRRLAATSSRAAGDSMVSGPCASSPPSTSPSPKPGQTSTFNAFQPFISIPSSTGPMGAASSRQNASNTSSSSMNNLAPSSSLSHEPIAAVVARCPVCNLFEGSEHMVDIHIEGCLSSAVGSSTLIPPPPSLPASMAEPLLPETNAGIEKDHPQHSVAKMDGELGERGRQADMGMGDGKGGGEEGWEEKSGEAGGEVDRMEDVRLAVAIVLSASPPLPSLRVLMKLLENILSNPSAAKFRRIRLSNPRIAQTVGTMVGSMEVLKAVGFQIIEEDGAEGKDAWACMETVDVEVLQEAVAVFGRKVGEAAREEGMGLTEPSTTSSVSTPVLKPKQVQKIDRQTRVFLSSSENAVWRIEVPESFYDRNAEELRREAMGRRKAMEERQMLVTRATREKAAAALKRRYTAGIMRFLFPDGIVLQGIFRPSEPTSSLYEFVAEALLDPAQEFELLHPVPCQGRSQVIASSVSPSGTMPTLDASDLIPASLIKFKASCLGPPGYTGLRRDLLNRVEPLSATPFIPA